MEKQKVSKKQTSKHKSRGNKQYTLEEKQGYIKQWEASNTEIVSYCRKQQLPISTFRQWIKNKQATGVQLKPVISQPILPIRQHNSRYEITLPNGIKIRTSDTVDITVLLMLAKELSRCN